MLRPILASVLTVCLAGPALAVEKPKLPSDARQLTTEEIWALYEGKTFAFENYLERGSLIGLARFDLANGRNFGRYRIGTEKGTFQSRIRVSDRTICYTVENRQEECNTVYISGQDVFEVASDGTVVTVIFLQ
jgi:hypothetical protein